ncbi:MAG: phosphoenolpyruvate--protein phosphotransferase, partial [Planctomycetes bacterium]|nr:phosphoenolpyruvate--protein phosphotransferase [Planctomycetota bacterium]
MEVKTGIPVSPGVAIARARVLDAEELRISRRHIRKDEVISEMARWEAAKDKAREELEALKDQVKSAVLKDEVALIFDTHLKILDDPVINNEIRDMIKIDHFTPEYAVTRAFRKVINAFRELKNAFFGQRISDFSDIQRRLLRALSGTQEADQGDDNEPVIVIARDLTPSQTANFAKGSVVAFATDHGGPTSHTAILANALGIPAVVGLGKITSDLAGGETIIIDGTRGRVIISPDEATKQKYLRRAEEYAERIEALSKSAGELRDETKDGVALKYLANIEFESEVAAALNAGARGLGLYRTEFIYAHNPHPSEDEHFQAISRALKAL